MQPQIPPYALNLPLPRRSRKRLILVVLAVLLAVGICFTVLVIVTIGRAKLYGAAKMDASSLSDFSQRVRAAEAFLSADAVRQFGEQSTAIGMFRSLATSGLLHVEALDKLAGATGSKGGEDFWLGEKGDPSLACIFTAPSDPKEFRARLLETKETGMVVMCSNRHSFTIYGEVAIVLLLTGESHARVVGPNGFEELTGLPYPDRLGDVLGKGPFAGIPPE